MNAIAAAKPQGKWRYKLDEVYTKRHTLLHGVEFANKWVIIVDDTITISKDYAWDGCSPSYDLPLIGWVGVPEGHLNEAGQPQSYHASLVHDVLCQFRKEIWIDRDSTTLLFDIMLVEGGISKYAAAVYTWAVKWLGPQKWLGKKPT